MQHRKEEDSLDYTRKRKLLVILKYTII